jgi:hypothetical protein
MKTTAFSHLDITITPKHKIIKFILRNYILLEKWVNEWLLFNANSSIFQLYHGENKLIFIEMMTMSAFFFLDQHV